MSNHPALRRSCSAEDGQALVLALVILVVGLVLGLGAVAFALNTSQQTAHDQRTRAAQQAADAGTQTQLYDNVNSLSSGFNLNGGPLGLSDLLDCAVPELNPGVVAGTVRLSARPAGLCPTVCVLASGSCSLPSASTGSWQPVDSETYQESEFLPNAVPQQSQSASTSNGDDVLFPEIVAIGCHTTASSNEDASCNDGGPGNSYARQLTLLKPTGPLQAVEARNDVTINSSLTALTDVLDGDVQCVALLCSLTNTTPNVLSGLTNLTSLLSLGTVSAVVSGVIGNTAALGVVDANIAAGHDLWLPNPTVDLNSSTGTLSPLNNTNLAQSLVNLGNSQPNPTSLIPTFEFGNAVCADGAPASCTADPTDGSSGTPVAAIQPDYVNTGGNACTPGDPNAQCSLRRPAFRLTTGPTGLTGISYSGGGSLSDNSGVLSVSGDSASDPGTITFAGGGAYTLCGLMADANVTLAVGGSGGVQIYVEAPGANGCPSSATNSAAGSVVVCGGVDNSATTGGLNLVSGAVNPSAMQIYVQGTSTTFGGGSLTVGSSDAAVTGCPWNGSTGTYSPGLGNTDPATQVYIGGPSAATQALVVYAPQSEVSVQSSAAFEGSAIGWNVDMTAVSVLQDLDLGNYPLSPVISAYQPAQSLACDNSIEALSFTESGNPPQNFGAGAPLSSGNAGDLNGC